MNPVERIAEEKLSAWEESGGFRGNPLFGAPLELEDLSRVPGELRSSFIVLRNAGVLPEELELRKEHLRLVDLIEACREGEERRSLEERVSDLRLRIDLLAERRKRRDR